MDMSHLWFYFHGDSTLRQLWGEFYSIIHKTQARMNAYVYLPASSKNFSAAAVFTARLFEMSLI